MNPDPTGNIVWGAAKFLFVEVWSKPHFRRRLGATVEARAGVRLRHYRFGGLVAKNYSELLRRLSEDELDAVGRILEEGVEDGYRSPDALRRVGEAIKEIALSEWGSEINTADQIRRMRDDLRQISSQLTRLSPIPTLPGADEIAEALRAKELFDREEDLDRLSFVMRDTLDSYGTYCVISAPPWYGKTAIMAELALDPPPSVDAVSFFVRAAQGRNRSADFLLSVNRQLEALVPSSDRLNNGETVSRLRANFERLWRVAAANAVTNGRSLCLLIDGLDEQDPNEEVPISALLPTTIPDNTLVLVAARPNPETFPGCGVGHDLERVRQSPYILDESPHARLVKERAAEAVARMRAESQGLAARCYGHLALTGIQWTDEDLGDLLSEDPDDIQRAVLSFVSLTLGNGSSSQPWELAHKELLAAVHTFRSKWCKDRLVELESWFNRWQQQEWPAKTPTTLVRSFWRAVSNIEGQEGLRRLATTGQYVRRMALDSLGRSEAMALTAQAIVDAGSINDRLSIIRIGLVRSEIMESVAALPAGAVRVLAQTGAIENVKSYIAEASSDSLRTDRIIEATSASSAQLIPVLLEMTNTIVDALEKSRSLAAIATAIARHDPGEARALIAQAIQLANSTNEWWAKRQALHLTAAVAQCDPGQMQALITQVAQLAITTTGRPWRNHDRLTAIATAIAEHNQSDTTLIDQATRVANIITNPSARDEALIAVAAAVAQHNPSDPALIARATEVANTITAPSSKSRALAAIAIAVARHGRSDPAFIAHATQLTAIITKPQDKSQALTAIACAVVQYNPSEAQSLITEATQLVSRAGFMSEAVADIAVQVARQNLSDPAFIAQIIQLAESITAPWPKRQALAAIAAAVAQHAPSMAQALIAQAVEFKYAALTAAGFQSKALAEIAITVAGHRPSDPALITQAIKLADAISDRWEKDRALAALANALAGDRPSDPPSIAQAIQLANAITWPRSKSQALVAIADTVAQHDPSKAQSLIAQAAQLDDTSQWTKDRTLVAIAAAVAQHNPSDSTLIVKAIKLADAISDRREKERALAAIAATLAQRSRSDPALITQATQLANTIHEPGAKRQAVVAIAAAVAPHDPNEAHALIAQAARLANAITEPKERIQALVSIAAAVTEHNPKQTRSLVSQALRLANTISDPVDRILALLEVAAVSARNSPSDAHALTTQATQLANAMLDSDEKNGALECISAAVARHNPSDPVRIAQATQLANTIVHGWIRSRTLADIARAVAECNPGNLTLIDQAIKLVDTVTEPQHKSRALLAVATSIIQNSPDKARALIGQASQIADTIAESEDRSHAFMEISAAIARQDPSDSALIAQATQLADVIAVPLDKCKALIAIAAATAKAKPDASSQILGRLFVELGVQRNWWLVAQLVEIGDQLDIEIIETWARNWAERR